MIRKLLVAGSLALALSSATPARAVSSAELVQNATYTYGRFEARIRFAAGDGVISSFFLWKPGSEMAGTFWNELDFEKLGADCRMQTNPLYGAPVGDHGQIASGSRDLCGEYHTYAFEWTPTYIAWRIDDVEVRREQGEVATAFVQNAASGMQIHFNLWPGDATFGGNFDAAILPVQQYISWVQYSSFEGGNFALQWREDFSAGALPNGWSVGNWASPKNYSTHAAANVSFKSDMAVLSLTADDATGFTGEPPPDGTVAVGAGGAAGSPGSDMSAPVEPAAAGSGTAAAGSGTAAAAPPGVVVTGTAGAAAMSNGSTSGAGGMAPVNGEASGAPAPLPDSSRRRSAGGCSVAVGPASASAWLVLAAGGVLASRRRRRAADRAARPGSGE
jgi:endo-1,3-1,4-beta-glycanase ExoK